MQTSSARLKPHPVLALLRPSARSDTELLQYLKEVAGVQWAQALDVSSASLLVQACNAARQWEQVALIFDQRKSDQARPAGIVGFCLN